jgi:hypothetical protein
MPAPILHLGATVLCSHAGQATPIAPFARVLVSGQPVVTLACAYTIVGCGLAGSGAPPCVTGQFLVGATRVLAGGAPLATLASQSTCVPSGTPKVPLTAQPRVLAT